MMEQWEKGKGKIEGREGGERAGEGGRNRREWWVAGEKRKMAKVRERKREVKDEVGTESGNGG